MGLVAHLLRMKIGYDLSITCGGTTANGFVLSRLAIGQFDGELSAPRRRT
jgi:hypothetical protein